MTLTQSSVLGAVQGLTELLPVSSSAPLALVSKVFHWPDEGLTYDVALHWGTLAALVAYFWRDLWGLAKAAVSREASPERRLAWGLVLGTVPGAAAGALIGDRVEVTMEIRKEMQGRVTTESVASLGSVSLLGEAAVDITASSRGTPIPPWGYVKAGKAAGG